MIPYGRGAKDIALQVKAETGTDTTVSQLEADLNIMVDAWKYETYPDAWKYMEWCGEQVREPGFLVNPWGRMRRFPKHIADSDLAGFGRQAQNFPELSGELKWGEFGGSLISAIDAWTRV